MAHSEVPSLEVLEERFVAWVEQSYHRRVHSETGEMPIERFSRLAKPLYPSQELLREAFLFSETRTVTKLATVSLFGNAYELDAALVGRKVELVFDPFDLEKVAVRYMGRGLRPGGAPKDRPPLPPHGKAQGRARAPHRHRLPGAVGGQAQSRARAPDRLQGHSSRRGCRMSIDQVRAYFGFTKMPFGKSPAPSALYRSQGHQEAVARIAFLVGEAAIGVVTGEVGSGKTVAARPGGQAPALPPQRRFFVYLPNPSVGAGAHTPS